MTLKRAWEPWLPTLQDIEVRKDSGDPQYSNLGWENLEVPDDCPHVLARMDQLKILFDETYFDRMINSETPSSWQIRLQRTFDRNVHRYERAYLVYETYAQELIDDIPSGEKESISRSVEGSESAEASAVSTPDLQINDSDRYADSKNKSSGSSTLGESIERTKRKTGDGFIDSLNESFRKWVDIDVAFVEEFQNNFLNLFWY